MKQSIKHIASDTTRVVTLAQSGDHCDATIDDRAVAVQIDRTDDCSGRLRIAGRNHRYYTLRRGESVHVWLDGRIYAFELPRPTARRAGADGSAGKASNQLTAPMPGTVLKINGAAGDRFAAHAPIIVMESMKMEMSLSAPAAVILKKIECTAGQLVEMGSILAQLEPIADEQP